MAFKNLKITGKKDMELPAPTTSNSPEPHYGYGTRVTFDKETLEKLGMDITGHKVGDTMEATVKIEVVGIQQRGKGNGDEASLELQITDIDLGDDDQAETGKFAAYKSIQDEGPEA